MKKLILGSSSPYRKELLQRLHIDFECIAPDIDETPLDDESASELVTRLGKEKAYAISKLLSSPAVIIAGDQVAVCDGEILGKPGDIATATQQLRKVSGKSICFLTSLCVLQSDSDILEIETIPYTVHFRKLSDPMIDRYLEKEPALNCAGAFKSEGFGISLCKKFEGDDPTALIGLPLIRLTTMLENCGIQVV